MSMLRILELARDPLFASTHPAQADWVPTGRPLEPPGRATGHADVARTTWPTAFRRAMAGRYDLVVLPAVRLRVPGDRRNRVKAFLRRLLIRVSTSGAATAALQRLLRLEATPHVLRDVGDFPEIEEASTGLFPKARLYLKREVLEQDLGTTVGRAAEVVYTPMPFDLEAYPSPSGLKETDVFFAARLNSDHRRRARRVLDGLADAGVVVDCPEERLSFEVYLQRMAAARLVVSPRGQGEHCYRHYEALLMGAVPVINRPDKPVHYALEHGITALFHDASDDALRATILEALEDHENLERMAGAGAELVRTTHAKQVICSDVLARLGFPPDALS
jgi:hypothetical protein